MRSAPRAQQTAGIGVLAASVLGAVLGVGNVAGQVAQSAAAGYVASYSRDQELQADQLGAEYLARNRYNPSNMVDVIGVLKDQERFAADAAKAEGKAAPSGSNWLSSHPSNDKRLEDIKRIAAGYTGSYGDDGRARYMAAMDGMTFGESREQGVTRGRNFYHEPLGFALTAPEGFKIVNSAEAVTVANAAGDAGLVVKTVPPKAGTTHDAIIRNVFKPDRHAAHRCSARSTACRPPTWSARGATRRDARRPSRPPSSADRRTTITRCCMPRATPPRCSAPRLPCARSRRRFAR